MRVRKVHRAEASSVAGEKPPSLTISAVSSSFRAPLPHALREERNFTHLTRDRAVSMSVSVNITENRLSKRRRRPLGLCGQRLPELNLIPIRVIDPGKATVGFIHSFGVNLYSFLF